MARMKTFFIYFLIFIGIYVVSQLLINAYIKTSYYKIESYEISDNQLTVTIDRSGTRASKDDGYIQGKISNNSDLKSDVKYMKVELYSEKNVNLGEEYVKIDEMNPNEVKDFKVRFTCDYVKHFKIIFLTQEEKAEIDANKETLNLPSYEQNEDVDRIVNMVEPGR